MQTYIDATGWNYKPGSNATDNIGFDWSKVKTAGEAFVVILAHESLHVMHTTVFYDVQKQQKNDASEIYKWFIEKGYGQEYADIFIVKEDGKFTLRDQEERNKLQHQYMQRHNLDMINSALEEYRREIGK